MEHEVVLATTRQVPKAVSVRTAKPGVFVAAWSADRSTWTMDLNDKGAALRPVSRIEESPGQGGEFVPESKKTFWPEGERTSFDSEALALLSLGDERVALAMLERPGKGRQGGAYLALLPRDRNPRVLRLGPAGEYANRITADAVGGDIVVAWHEGKLASSEVLLTRVGIEPLRVKKATRIGSGNAAASPSVAFQEGHALIAWSEIEHRRVGPRSLIRVAPLSADLELGETVTAAEGRFLESSPRLAPAGDMFGLVHRDDKDRDGTPEFYFSAVGADGVPALKPQRISQADGWRGPSLVYVAPYLMSTTIRSFQRNLLIGMNRFDKQGVKQGGEFQVYADKTDFVRVDLAVSGQSMLMVYAEDRRGSGRILAGQVQCRGDDASR